MMVHSHWLRKCLICLLRSSWPCGPCLASSNSFVTPPSAQSAAELLDLSFYCLSHSWQSALHHTRHLLAPSLRYCTVTSTSSHLGRTVQTTDDGDMPQEGRTHIQDGGDYPYGVPRWLKEQPELQRRGILLTDMLRPASIRITSLFLCN